MPGQVKTRLCPPLEASQAAGLAAAMLMDVLDRCQAAAQASQFRLGLWYTPHAARPWFEAIAPGLALHPQQGAGLAQRLAQAFAEGLGQPGVESMVVIGSDQPLVGAGRLLEAHRALEAGTDLVLGPDAGGGYYLIGMRSLHPELFSSINMSTAHMFQETLSLAESMGLGVSQLEAGYDVDVQADLARLAMDLASWNDPSDPDFPRHSRDFIEQLPAPLARLLFHG